MNFELLLKEYQLELDNRKLNQLDSYKDLLIETNKKFNLTTITDPQEIYVKHFLDCLLLTKSITGGSLCDVGSGAGFPGIVLAISNPQLQLTLLEPNNKKVGFLSQVVNQLELSNVTISNQRSEDYCKTHRESFDYVTARAVASLNTLSELCLPLLKVGGHFLAMKGPKGEQELQEAENALKKLHTSFIAVQQFTLPDGQERLIIDLIKNQVTDIKYPRNYGQIKNKPL